MKKYFKLTIYDAEKNGSKAENIFTSEEIFINPTIFTSEEVPTGYQNNCLVSEDNTSEQPACEQSTQN